MLSSNPASASTMPYRQDAACAGRFRSMPVTNFGMLIGLARNGCPWICRPDRASAFVTRAVRNTAGVLCNVGSDSIYLELPRLNSTFPRKYSNIQRRCKVLGRPARGGVLNVLPSIRSGPPSWEEKAILVRLKSNSRTESRV